MALRDQPYMPLYVQDYLTDERLNSCSASSQGVYIKIMCILHKQETYGTILLKQKDKQTDKQIINFALKFAKLLPFDNDTIEKALAELVEENVLIIEGDKIFQKRMVKDFHISEERSKSGKKGGGNPNLFKQTDKQTDKQNTEYENQYITSSSGNNSSNNIITKNSKKIIFPTFEEVDEYFSKNGFPIELAKRFFEGYSVAEWKDSQGKQVKNWKQKAQMVWFKEENKTKYINNYLGAEPESKTARMLREIEESTREAVKRIEAEELLNQ